MAKDLQEFTKNALTQNPDAPISIYTDGACKGNPGVGGWGALILVGKEEIEVSGYEAMSTNNRMEMMAAIGALRLLPNDFGKERGITLYTDSQYLQQGITSWISNWKKNNWQTAEKRPVKNIDLWQELDFFCDMFQLEWKWIRGHAGHYYNEFVDGLAQNAIIAYKIATQERPS
jgi:ribonuclease HI